MDKSTQVLESAYKSLGGPGSYSGSDNSQFRTAVQNASPQQVQAASQDIWTNLLRPAVKDGQPIPTNEIEQVELIFDRMHKLFTESAVGATTRSS